MVVFNDKPIRLTNKKAIRLAKQRALSEGRSATNAATQTIIEALGEKNITNNVDVKQKKSEGSE